jgi:hypothetical protein
LPKPGRLAVPDDELSLHGQDWCQSAVSRFGRGKHELDTGIFGEHGGHQLPGGGGVGLIQNLDCSIRHGPVPPCLEIL